MMSAMVSKFLFQLLKSWSDAFNFQKSNELRRVKSRQPEHFSNGN